MVLSVPKALRAFMTVAAIGVVTAACASTPVAKASLQRAEESGAPELAPVELAAARDEFARAEKAAADRDNQNATQLAERANVDAQLAEASAIQQRSHKAAVEFDVSMQALRQESMRNTPPTP
jgi:Na+/glutamate symporter